MIEPLPIKGLGYKLIKDWDFGVTVRDLAEMRAEFFTRYIYNNGKQDYLNDEWERFRDNNNHVFNDPGSLSLVARAPTTIATGKIESGMLRSKWSGKYGYFEARLKVPRGLGMWPTFWLNPDLNPNGVGPNWPPEIDILEMVNNGKDATTKSSFHNCAGTASRVGMVTPFTLLNQYNQYKPANTDFADGFHTFSAEWTSAFVKWYVDGTLVRHSTYKWLHDDGTDGGKAHVLMDLAVGGKWAGAPVATSFPAELEVDYIRIWQKGPA